MLSSASLEKNYLFFDLFAKKNLLGLMMNTYIHINYKQKNKLLSSKCLFITTLPLLYVLRIAHTQTILIITEKNMIRILMCTPSLLILFALNQIDL